MLIPSHDDFLDPSEYTRKSADPYLIGGKPSELALACPNPHANKRHMLAKAPETIEELALFLVANSGQVRILHDWYSGRLNNAYSARQSYRITIEHIVDVEPDPGVSESTVITNWSYDDFQTLNEGGELELEEAVLGYVADSNNEKLRAMLEALLSKQPDSALLYLKNVLKALGKVILACPERGSKIELGEEILFRKELERIYQLVQEWTPKQYYWHQEPCVKREGSRLVTECLQTAESYSMPVVPRDEVYQFLVLLDLECNRDAAKHLFPTISVTPRRVYFHTDQPKDELADPLEVLQTAAQKERIVKEVKDILSQAFDMRIIIRGYADKQGAIGYDNQALSLRRSQWLRKILRQEIGHRLGYIMVQGCGDKYAPEEPLDSPKDRVAVIEFIPTSPQLGEVR